MKSTTIKLTPSQKTQIPQRVHDVADALYTKGYTCFLAGGCVRDILMSRAPRDWDIVTDAPLSEIQTSFPKHVDVGVAFGIVKLIGEPAIDVAIFRKESGYSDSRHPDTVEVGDAQTDVERRDFTVNALLLDIKSNDVLDYTDGIKDINSKLIRTVGDAKKRFSEDALRMLRAIRFSAQLGFKIEPATFQAIKANAKLIQKISKERVREEIFRLLESTRPVVGLENLMKAGLWELVLGVKKTSFPADLRAIRFVEKPTALAWICALSVTGLMGDPLMESKELVERLTENLRLSKTEKKTLTQLMCVFSHSDCKIPVGQSPLDWIELAKSDKILLETAKRFIRRARGIEIEKKEEAIRLIDQSLRWALKPHKLQEFPNAELLMREGLKPGPKLGSELNKRLWEKFWAFT